MWIRLALVLVSLATIYGVSAKDLTGRYANSPLKGWYEAQLVPGGPRKGQSCCTIADGQDAQEDIRDGQYWAQWLSFPWTPVPWEAVLTGPNPVGRPVVWWANFNGNVVIRCYAPGSLM